MGSIRRMEAQGTLFMDFRLQGKRIREYTALPDTAANRKRLQKALDRIEGEIALGTFDYAKTFGKPMPQDRIEEKVAEQMAAASSPATPLMKDFAETWYRDTSVAWRKSYCVTQRGALDQYILPFFGEKEVGRITKADVLEFRSSLAKVQIRKKTSTLSNRRINSVMKPLRQILNEAADRFEFNSAFRNIKPLKNKRTDVNPFSLQEVQTILTSCRKDYRSYYTLRIFTGMRTGEVHGLKWKYVDWERRLILVRESIVLDEEDELKTDGSMRDIQMNQLVFDALKEQFKVTGATSEYVFTNGAGGPIDNQNFVNRIWTPMLRNLGFAHRRAYQMRHTAATLWLAAGEAPEWIARQLGHTTTEMLFRVYSRYVPNLTRRDGSAMDRLLAQHISVTPVTGKVERVETNSQPKSSDLPDDTAPVKKPLAAKKSSKSKTLDVQAIDVTAVVHKPPAVQEPQDAAEPDDSGWLQAAVAMSSPASNQTPPLTWTDMAKNWRASQPDQTTKA